MAVRLVMREHHECDIFARVWGLLALERGMPCISERLTLATTSISERRTRDSPFQKRFMVLSTAAMSATAEADVFEFGGSADGNSRAVTTAGVFIGFHRKANRADVAPRRGFREHAEVSGQARPKPASGSRAG